LTSELSLSKAHAEIEDCEREAHTCISPIEYEVSSQEIVQGGDRRHDMRHTLIKLLELIISSALHGLCMACCPVDWHYDEHGEDSE